MRPAVAEQSRYVWQAVVFSSPSATAALHQRCQLAHHAAAGGGCEALTCADDASVSSSHRMCSLPSMEKTGFTRAAAAAAAAKTARHGR